MTRKAFYPGSFDPFTNGHLDILLQALGLADEVVIAIGVHSSKPGMFSFQERRELIQQVVPEALSDRVSVISFDNLTTDAAVEAGATMMIRGVRDGSDLDYEMQLAGMNGTLNEHLQTVFLPASPDTRPITATLVRQVASMGGDASHFVPEPVAKALALKFPQAG